MTKSIIPPPYPPVYLLRPNFPLPIHRSTDYDPTQEDIQLETLLQDSEILDSDTLDDERLIFPDL